MSHKVKFGVGIGLLTVLLAVVLYRGSFSTGEYGPATAQQTYVYWGLSTVTFLLTVLLGFILFRDAIKLYIARRAGVEGSKIRTKIPVAVLSLCFLPTMFLMLWSVEVLNRNLDKWFSRPAQAVRLNLEDIGATLEKETRQRAGALALWLADADDTQDFVKSGHLPAEFFAGACSGTGWNAPDSANRWRPDHGLRSVSAAYTAKGSPRPRARKCVAVRPSQGWERSSS